MNPMKKYLVIVRHAPVIVGHASKRHWLLRLLRLRNIFSLSIFRIRCLVIETAH